MATKNFLNHKKIEIEKHSNYNQIIIPITKISLQPISYIEEVDNEIKSLINNCEFDFNEPLLITIKGAFNSQKNKKERDAFLRLLVSLIMFALSTDKPEEREKRLTPPEKITHKLVGWASLKRFINNKPKFNLININIVDKKDSVLIEVF